MSRRKWDSKDKTIARLCILIVLLIMLLILMFVLKEKQKKEESQTCGATTGYTIDIAYSEYLNNLKNRNYFTFYDVTQDVVNQLVITDQNELYATLNVKNKNYKSVKNKLEDIAGLYNVEHCQKGIKIDAIQAVNIFLAEYKNTTYVFVLDEKGITYNIYYDDDDFKLMEIPDFKYIVQIYNSIENDTEKVYAVDVQGKVTEINSVLEQLK